MSRINTNVSSLVAQNTLGRNNNDLQQALGRLSTGLRINSGADDPAGLIASENLRRDITVANRAIQNSERAGQLISTADSALGQVSSLLNDIRGLVTEAANSGVLSDDQVAANQLQVDSSLEAIDRISQVTTFQGRKLLDGTLDFNVTEGADFDRISNLQIGQGNLGTTGQVAVAVEIQTAATLAQVDLTNIPAATTAVNAFANTAFTNTESQAVANITLGSTAIDLQINAVNGGVAEDASGNAVSLVVADNGGGATTTSFLAGVLTVNYDLGAGTVDGDAIAAAIQAHGGASVNFTATATAGGATPLVLADNTTYAGQFAGGRDAGSATVRVTSDTAGSAANGVTATIAESLLIANNSAVATINGTTGNIDVDVRGTVSYAAIATAIDGLTGYSASVTATSGDANYIDTQDTPPGVATLGSGVDAAGGLAQDVVFELAGQNGREVFSFQANASINQVATAINALSDSTGATATINGTTLELNSSEYGSNAYVEVSVVSEAAGGTITAAVGSQSRDTGTDVAAAINGLQAVGNGNSLTLNTSILDLGLDVDAGFTGTSNFTITGGGALFQLGPQVVTNQQARLGIGSVSTARLGGASGRLYELRNGESKSLANDTTAAAEVVDEVITNIVELRGRLGAFQRTTLQSNIASLSDTLVNLTAAESSIRDADFAKESASLTRAQILVQSSTSVLAIANQNPQNVLSLLR
ncbi:MAG: flagellin [Planctomycetes bacterium]|nr:flagellin [Planctomycetota bacterium]